jgi:uncharacterized protein (DUF2147 family)
MIRINRFVGPPSWPKLIATGFTLILIFFLGLFLSPPCKASQVDPIGTWLTQDGEAIVEITAEDDTLMGKIVWLKEPLDENGRPKLDDNNPHGAKATILGLVILKDFSADGDSKWSGGTIYDPDNGKTYKCTMKLKEGALHIRGFIGVSLFGRTAVWTRTDPPNSISE